MRRSQFVNAFDVVGLMLERSNEKGDWHLAGLELVPFFGFGGVPFRFPFPSPS